ARRRAIRPLRRPRPSPRRPRRRTRGWLLPTTASRGRYPAWSAAAGSTSKTAPSRLIRAPATCAASNARLQSRQLDRPGGLERSRRAQHQRIGVARADEVQAHGQALAGEAAGDGRRGLLRKVEREAERRPVDPALFSRWT